MSDSEWSGNWKREEALKKWARPFRHAAETALRGEKTPVFELFSARSDDFGKMSAIDCTLGLRGKISLRLPGSTACEM